MTTIRCAHDDDNPFVMVTRPACQNRALSYEALGMLTYLLSQPDDWIIGVDDLIREGCGRDRVYRLLKELRDAGHLVHDRKIARRKEPPVWADRTVYEQSVTSFTELVKAGNGSDSLPNPEKPDMAKRLPNRPVPEKPELAAPTHAGAVVLALQDQSAQGQEIQEQKEKEKSTLSVMDDPDAPITDTEREHAKEILSTVVEKMNGNGGGHWKTDAEIRAEVDAALLKYPSQRKAFES